MCPCFLSDNRIQTELHQIDSIYWYRLWPVWERWPQLSHCIFGNSDREQLVLWLYFPFIYSMVVSFGRCAMMTCLHRGNTQLYVKLLRLCITESGQIRVKQVLLRLDNVWTMNVFALSCHLLKETSKKNNNVDYRSCYWSWEQ